MNTAIVVAAGSGSRFDSNTPKQFIKLLGKPVLIHTLEKFEACDAITSIILVLSPEGIEVFAGLAEKSTFSKIEKVVAGGKSRAESVFNGLQEVDPRSEIVAVHDGARPLVSVGEIDEVIEKARETGAACLAAEVTDTIKETAGGIIVGTIDRGTLRRALTPQAFRYEILKKAFAQAELDESVTDECQLVERLGYDIFIVEGNPRNIKITRPEDLVLAAAILEANNQLKSGW